MTATAKFYIAQYIPDPFRKEPTNVGVIAMRDGKAAGKFFAENDKGGIIKANARRRVLHPGIYRQWIDYWKECVRRGEDGIAEALNEPRDNFRLLEGGSVSEIGEDTPNVIASCLYRRIVAEEADARPASARLMPRFEKTVYEFFKQYNLLTHNLGVQNPIVAHQPVTGSVVPHIPSFVQKNGHLIVMQTVYVGKATTRRTIMERAGYTANMFKDIEAVHPGAEAIAIMNVDVDIDHSDDVDRLSKVVADAATQVVDWRDEPSRFRFMQDRIRIASRS